jgi:outer membrane lipopolysaccharide assembly protein LptE/RlpB
MNFSEFRTIKLSILISLSTMASGCGFQTYVAKPIQPTEVIQQLESKSPDSNEFRAYLIAQNYPQNQLPIQQWGLDELRS